MMMMIIIIIITIMMNRGLVMDHLNGQERQTKSLLNHWAFDHKNLEQIGNFKRI